MAQASGSLSFGVPLSPSSSVVPSNQSNSGVTDHAGTRADSLPPSASAPFSESRAIIPISNFHGSNPTFVGAEKREKEAPLLGTEHPSSINSSGTDRCAGVAHEAPSFSGQCAPVEGAAQNRLLVAPSLRYVLKFRNGFYLNQYRRGDSDSGVWSVADVQRAKVFSIAPTGAARLLNAEILSVLVNADGCVEFDSEVIAKRGRRSVVEETEVTGAVKTGILTEKVRMSVSSHLEHLYRSIVEQVPRARYQGMQEGDPEIGLSPLILFTGPCGSTLALKPADVSAENVRQAVALKEAEFNGGAA